LLTAARWSREIVQRLSPCTTRWELAGCPGGGCGLGVGCRLPPPGGPVVVGGVVLDGLVLGVVDRGGAVDPGGAVVLGGAVVDGGPAGRGT